MSLMHLYSSANSATPEDSSRYCRSSFISARLKLSFVVIKYARPACITRQAPRMLIRTPSGGRSL